MRINITFRHVESSDDLKEYAEQRLKKLKKYADGPMDVNVVLTVEKFRNTAEVVISGDGIRAAAKEMHEDMKAAIDLVSDKIEKQLKKFREKLKTRNKRQAAASKGATPPAPEISEAGSAEVPEEIIHVEKLEYKPMSVEEAVAQLQVLGQDFIVFTNAETNKINVIYWRKDGTLGLIEP